MKKDCYTMIIEVNGQLKVSRSLDPIKSIMYMDNHKQLDKILLVLKGDYVWAIRKFGIKLFLGMLKEYDPFESMVFEIYPLKHSKL